ncbi:MAG: FAD-dependent oxidoreductase [Oscillospiraceae bacterium]|nr:FAD-dependent oxidoreductase [Oscillospiraceae bacterium]
MKSVWMNETKMPEFEPLRGERKTDVLIIGGGLAGILCAYQLEKAGVDYALIEADRLCRGVTGFTTAKITAQHGLIYEKLLRTFGSERAKMYLDANLAAVEQYRKLCSNIKCDFEEKDAYVYTTGPLYAIEDEIMALDELGYRADFARKLPLPVPITGAVEFPKQAQFNPLKFAAAIVPELNIYEQTKAIAYEGDHTVLTNLGRIRAEEIIAATHFPIFNKHGSYFLKLYQHRSYVIALENAANVGGMYVDENKKGLSFRNYGNLLLLGGGSHRTGKQGGNWSELTQFAKKHYPQARETGRWATQDCMSLDGVPYIGQYSKNTPELYVATGFNKWGITSSMAASMILTDLVQGKDNAWAAVFSPSRSILRPQLAANAVEATVNLLMPTKPRCPHMGCALKWNASEHTWDCSCHGSRFTETGKVINNPANDDLKREK